MKEWTIRTPAIECAVRGPVREPLARALTEHREGVSDAVAGDAQG